MSFTPFNTYDYVKELVQGSFSEQQAEANMRELVKSLNFTIEHKLATKDELQEVIHRLDSLENRFTTEFITFENKFATKDELNAAINRLEKDIHSLNYKIEQVFLKTVVSTGGMLTIACSIMTFLIKF